MTSTSRFATPPKSTTLAVGSIAVLIGLAASVGSTTGVASAQPAVHATGHSSASQPPASWKTKLLKPAKKYYGVSLVDGLAALSDPNGISKIKSETAKQPNLLMFFQSWDAQSAGTKAKANLDVTDVKKACSMGLLPMLTWESWNTKNTTPGQGVSYTQPAFAPAKITSGAYDTYIRATAVAVKSLGTSCPLAIRFDHEQNGYWYPWGVTTAGMNTFAGETLAQRAAAYVAMWQHVENIFNKAGATNVLWVWSPNYQGVKHPKLPDYSGTYPGDSYVDWVGIDAYYNAENLTFKDLFGQSITQLNQEIPEKPRIVAETGVGSFPDKPAEITDLLASVAKRPQIKGLIYLDEQAPRNNWQFDQTPASLKAFKAGINASTYAAGKPGDL